MEKNETADLRTALLRTQAELLRLTERVGKLERSQETRKEAQDEPQTQARL